MSEDGEKKYEIDFSQWKGARVLSPVQAIGGFDKKQKKMLSATPMKIYFIKVFEAKAPWGKMVRQAKALAELETGEKVNVYLPEEFAALYMEKKDEYKGKLLVPEKKVNITYSIRVV